MAPQASISERSRELHDLVRVVRKWVVSSQSRAALKQRGHLNSVAASLDSILYTQEAIDSFRSIDAPRERGEAYLRLYGLLQALVLQQDAVRSVGDAVDLDFSFRDYELDVVRRARVETAHAPRTNDGASHFPIELDDSGRTFTIMSFKEDEVQPTGYSTFALLHQQEDGVIKALQDLVTHIGSQER